jgi:drug/metabolite transporter (DMT)-like permease
MGRVVFTFVWWTCSVIPLFAIYGFGPAILGALHMGEGMDVIGSAIITVVFLIGTVVAVLLVNRMSRRRMIGITVLSGAILTLLGALICVRFAPKTRELTLVEAAKLNPDAPTVGQTTAKFEYSEQ